MVRARTPPDRAAGRRPAALPGAARPDPGTGAAEQRGQPADRPLPAEHPAPAPPAGPPPAAIGTLEPPPPPPPAGPAVRGPGWPAVLGAVLGGLWIVAVTAGLHILGWLIEQLLLAGFDLATPFWFWPAVSLFAALLAAAPAVLLAVIPRAPAVRAAGRAWSFAVVALAVLGLARAVPLQHNEFTLAALAVSGFGTAALLRPRGPARTRRGPARTGRGAAGAAGRGTAGTGRGTAGADRVPLAVAAGLASLVPWLWLGSLGGLAETVLGVVAAIAAGRLAAAVLSGVFGPGNRDGRVVVPGLVAAVALTPLAAGLGGSGVHLLELLVLPPLGFALAALGGGRPVAVLTAIAALGPLAFVDPEETGLLLGLRDVGWWALIAAATALAVALLAGLGYGRGLRRNTLRGWLAWLAAAGVAAAAAGVHLTLGHPGLHGERLFVVMREQADLTGLDRVTGRAERIRATRDRLVRTAERSQAALRDQLRRAHLRYTPYYLVNGVEVEGGPAVRGWLARRSDVDRVLLSQRLRPLPARAPAATGSLPAPAGPAWNIAMVQADRVWRELGSTGTGIVVGTSDSGVDGTHPALRDRFRGGDDSWFDPWRHSRTPTDHNGHGTHTLGTAVGGAGVGVAPGARWIGCVNLDRDLGNPALYLDCLQFMLAPFPFGGDPWRDGRPERAPHVLTNSWGCPELEGCDLGALRQATAALRAAGIFVVAAAGNSGPRCGSVDDPPAPYPDVFTVGAVDSRRRVAAFSSRGPTAAGAGKPDLVAPGVGVLSARPGGGYGRDTGTSMATPHVAGVVALMWSANPALIGDLDRTAEILRGTAGGATATYLSNRARDRCGAPANVTGAGVVDAYAAVRAATGA
jgi:hypothetical protein